MHGEDGSETKPTPVILGGKQDDLAVELHVAEGRVCAMEASLAMVGVQLHRVDEALAHLRALALSKGIKVTATPPRWRQRRSAPEPARQEVEPDAPTIPSLDETSVAKAKRVLHRNGFVRVTP